MRYWIFIETGMVIIILAVVVSSLRKNTNKDKKKQSLPESLFGKVFYFFKYILKVVGVGLGMLLLISLIVMIERSIITVYTETAPAPSQVDVPAGLPFDVEEITFKSEDGVMLAGWYSPSKNNATVILLHGYGGNRTGMLWYAKQLVHAGYGILMYDERASGESGGDHRSYGWEDTKDVKAALQFISARDEDAHIGAAGCSMGASIVVYSAALFPEIEAVWGDGNSSVRAQDLPPSKNPLITAMTAGNYLLDWMYEVKLGIEAPAPLTEVIDRIAPRPLMLVGGGLSLPALGNEGDLYTRRFAELAGGNAQAWIIPEATHCNGPAARPDEYAIRLIKFFNESLLR